MIGWLIMRQLKKWIIAYIKGKIDVYIYPHLCVCVVCISYLYHSIRVSYYFICINLRMYPCTHIDRYINTGKTEINCPLFFQVELIVICLHLHYYLNFLFKQLCPENKCNFHFPSWHLWTPNINLFCSKYRVFMQREVCKNRIEKENFLRQ